MYQPRSFEETRPEALHALMRARPLATLITLTADGLEANPVPLLLDTTPDNPRGVLRGHVARANPVWKTCLADSESLAIFHGDDAYVSSSWYPSKHENGKAVPTWNYVTVQAYGVLRVVDDAVWLRRTLEALTLEHEANFAQPWSIADAPADYIEKMIAAVVGIELHITRSIGKWKVSQNHPPANRQGVAQGLRGVEHARASGMAEWVAGYGARD